jgi:hypothetical protein
VQLRECQSIARLASKGLWSAADPIAPWDWRKGVRASEQDNGTDFWLNTDTNMRHNPTCRWYRNTNEGKLFGGEACDECGG